MAKLTLTFKGRVIDVFHLESGTTYVGRNEDCTIPIDSLAIAPVQAALTLDSNDAYQLQAMDEEYPVMVNHEKVEQTLLHHGDVIQIGKHALSFAEDVMDLSTDLGQASLPADQAPDPDIENEIGESKLSSGVLQIMNGDNFGRIIPLKRNLTRIGHAGGDCAMIARREDGYFISFLEGSNPPSVNKHPIGDNVQILLDGDVIDLGGAQMQFHDSSVV